MIWPSGANQGCGLHEKIRILILTPRFPPHVGGGAEVYGTYARMLDRHPRVRLRVLTEVLSHSVHDESFSPGVRIYRFLPLRDNKGPISLGYKVVSFILQYLILTILLPILILIDHIDVVHYTRYYWSPFLIYLKLIRILTGIKLIVDLRNPDQAEKFNFRLKAYDRILTNSEGTHRAAQAMKGNSDGLHLIPTPFLKPVLSFETGLLIKVSNSPFDLESVKPYVAFCGIVSERKNPHLLLNAFQQTRCYQEANYSLIFAGENRVPDWNRRVQQVNRVYYLGPLSHADSIKVIRGAELYVLPSGAEGVPRSCLEALSLGVSVLVPPGIPEFDRYLPQCVLSTLSIDSLAAAIDSAVDQGCRGNYPFEINDPITVTNTLVSIYQELTAIARPIQGLA
ncbi:MAG: glycosyltransferase family 4 protein [Deltaproteobacteria bacterium]|nr:glycosyltransferase family 4 protein [Deltaproteobacteria bacterium]